MRTYGYSAILDVWEDKLTELHSIVPAWFAPNTVVVDVPSGREGVLELQSIMGTVDPGANIVLSARAQRALLEIMTDQQRTLEDMFVASVELPTDVGEAIRSSVVERQKILEANVVMLSRAQQEALRLGVPPASMDEEEATRLAAVPWIIAGAVVIVAAIIVGAMGLIKYLESKSETDLVSQALAAAIAEGRWDSVPGILGVVKPPEKPFPWGWVAGIGVVAIGGGLVYAWYKGYMRASGEALARKTVQGKA